MRKLRRPGSREDDPLDGVANFFDLGVIFALGFMVPLIARLSVTPSRSGTQSKDDSAKVQADQRVPLERYRPSTDHLAGDGQRLGVAYRLENGDVIYVPENRP